MAPHPPGMQSQSFPRPPSHSQPHLPSASCLSSLWLILPQPACLLPFSRTFHNLSHLGPLRFLCHAPGTFSTWLYTGLAAFCPIGMSLTIFADGPFQTILSRVGSTILSTSLTPLNLTPSSPSPTTHLGTTSPWVGSLSLNSHNALGVSLSRDSDLSLGLSSTQW